MATQLLADPLVHRIEAHPFNQNEIDLLLLFANYATLAWEHAVLYERSDERLREVARENELLYQQASEEKQKLEAIMGSMSDGLVLTGIDGTILYANLGASVITGLPIESLEHQPTSTLYGALCSKAVYPQECERALKRAACAEATELVVEVTQTDQQQAIHLRLFDVNDESGRAIGRGLLLRDVTRERELDEFKTTLRRTQGETPPRGSGVKQFGDLEIDLAGHVVRLRGAEVRLLPTEFALLKQLIINVGRVVTHRMLLQSIWGPEYGGEAEYLRVYMNRLRHKLELDPANPRYLLTEPGVGYRFVAP